METLLFIQSKTLLFILLFQQSHCFYTNVEALICKINNWLCFIFSGADTACPEAGDRVFTERWMVRYQSLPLKRLLCAWLGFPPTVQESVGHQTTGVTSWVSRNLCRVWTFPGPQQTWPKVSGSQTRLQGCTGGTKPTAQPHASWEEAKVNMPWIENISFLTGIKNIF